MGNETVEEFLARGGKIKTVGRGKADELIETIQKKPWVLNSRYHYCNETPISRESVILTQKIKKAKWASHSRTNKEGCKK